MDADDVADTRCYNVLPQCARMARADEDQADLLTHLPLAQQALEFFASQQVCSPMSVLENDAPMMLPGRVTGKVKYLAAATGNEGPQTLRSSDTRHYTTACILQGPEFLLHPKPRQAARASEDQLKLAIWLWCLGRVPQQLM
mmetsp:Transcript_45266/g.96706  ORF Transcript_45266/g.96706 Transcript_45266/m.96706 type:complete len:142 (+) Transcript_45266:891-1316(+)